MQKYRDVVLDNAGNIVIGAVVTVALAAGGAATIYSDNGTTVVTSATSDSTGTFFFYAANGRYTITVTPPAISGLPTIVVPDILLEDIANSLAAPPGSSLIGFIQAGVGAVLRTAESKLRDTKHAYDIGCACDGSTDDWSKISAYILGEVAAGRTPRLEFPAGTTTMVSQAVPWRNNVAYICKEGFATIKAHSTSTDNVLGEHPTGAQPYSGIYCKNLIIDGNRANVAYNTRNGGVTDDAYQNTNLTAAAAG